MKIKMQAVYLIAGISRQSYHKSQKKLRGDEVMWQRLLEMVVEFRKEYPRSSARKIHQMLKISEVGINRFEAFVASQGLSIKPHRSVIKTTWRGTYFYPNLVNGLEIDSIDMLWVSDITYFITPSINLYIVLILDVYSHRIIGYSTNNNMRAINNIKALQMAFSLRGEICFKSLIHHSDKGSQYSAIEYVKVLKSAEIKISMANTCLENPYAERINGIIKNDYLVAYTINSLADLKKALPKAVNNYNNYVHGKLKGQSPIEFEECLMKKQDKKAEVMKLYNFEK